MKVDENKISKMKKLKVTIFLLTYLFLLNAILRRNFPVRNIILNFNKLSDKTLRNTVYYRILTKGQVRKNTKLNILR